VSHCQDQTASRMFWFYVKPMPACCQYKTLKILSLTWCWQLDAATTVRLFCTASSGYCFGIDLFSKPLTLYGNASAALLRYIYMSSASQWKVFQVAHGYGLRRLNASICRAWTRTDTERSFASRWPAAVYGTVCHVAAVHDNCLSSVNIFKQKLTAPVLSARE